MKKQTEFKIRTMCKVLQVSRSSYYDYSQRPPSPHDIEDDRIRPQVKTAFKKGRENYGTRRIKIELKKENTIVSRRRIGRLMQEEDLQVKTKRKFKVTTDSNHNKQIAPNLIEREFDVATQDTVYVGDITYISTREGWLYLAVILELFSRQVIGWSMGTKNNAELVQDALTMALWRRGEVNDVIVHSDQGSTYASGDYQRQLSANQLRCSMSRKGECLDNAVAESFFGSLKNELVYHEDYKTRAEARQSIFEYIEVFYNRKRRHAFLNYMTPVEYEEKYTCN